MSKITTNKNYCILFSTKNQYKAFEDLIFAKSAADFHDVLMINTDANSSKEELELAEKVCDRNNIHWINKDDLMSGVPMQNCIKMADEWLTENGVEVDWILHFHDDCYPTINDFWEKLDHYLEKYDEFKEKVGMFGFRVQGTKFGRGCLVQEILENPYNGWYTHNMPSEYQEVDYFVAEVPHWCGAGINRKLFREHVKINNNYKLNLWGDDVCYQFMMNGIYNIIFPHLHVIHDISGKKTLGVKESFEYHNLYTMDEEHKVFKDNWKFWWGVRNKNLRQEFNEAWEFYSGTIQEKLFMTSISEGPKTIEYFENWR